MFSSNFFLNLEYSHFTVFLLVIRHYRHYKYQYTTCIKIKINYKKNILEYKKLLLLIGFIQRFNYIVFISIKK